MALTPDKALRLGWAALAVAALALALGPTIADIDLWGHTRYGLDILATGDLTPADPYSYLSEGRRWINHEWLAETAMALAWRAGGAPALVALTLAIGLLIAALLFRELRLQGLHPVRAVLLLVALGAPIARPFESVRPQIFTYLCFTLLMMLIRRAEAGRYRVLWLAAPLMALWSNLHGGVLAGVGVLGFWTLLRLRSHFADRWRFAPAALAAAAATLANPAGIDLLLFLVDTATGARPEIASWQPVAIASVWGALYIASIALVVASLRSAAGARNPNLLAVLALVALLPLLANRHLALFSIATVVLAGGSMADAWRARCGAFAAESRAPRWGTALAPVLAAAVLLAFGATRGRFTEIGTDRPDVRWPVAAVALLDRSGVHGNLMTEFEWGEYVLWHLRGRIKVGMDGRRETLYSPQAYDRYLAFKNGVNDWDAILRQPPADAVLVKRADPPDNLLRLDPAWTLVFEDPASALFARRTSALRAPLQDAAATFTPPAPAHRFPE